MKRDYFICCNIAGFRYYEGAIAMSKLKIGSKLTLKCEPKNTYDKHAIIVYKKKLKLGYIPKTDNRKLALLLKHGGVEFETVVQRIVPEAHPENQLEIIVYLLTPEKEKSVF